MAKGVRYDYRHRKCNRLLFRAYLEPGTVIQIRCPKCGGMVMLKSSENGTEALDMEEKSPIIKSALD